MASNITLTSSMRSNLSSLKSLASQMSVTQTRLSTGKKVNSAIDNANSYYQSRALTNRSSDLDMLLDAMGQSIQTITAAVQGLEATGEILENAAVIAQNAYEAAIIPEKAWFEEQVGPNGVVVTSAQELRDAIAANKEIICVYGHIDMGEITTGLTLQNNQKLVGIGYFGDFDSEIDKFSSISANHRGNTSLISIDKSGCEIANLSLNYHKLQHTDFYYGTIEIIGVETDLSDLDMKSTSDVHASFGVIYNKGIANLYGNINISADTYFGLWNNSNEAIINIQENSKVKISTTGSYALGIVNEGGTTNIAGKLDITTLGTSSYGLYNYSSGNNKINIESTSEVKIVTKNAYNIVNKSGKKLIISEDAKLALGIDEENVNYYQVTSDFNVNSNMYITNDNIRSLMNVSQTEPWAELQEQNDEEILRSQETIAKDLAQYSEMMSAFDELVSDAGYQGVNLLADGNIDVMFNETRTHSYNVQGKDMSSAGIGITTREWVTKDDVAQSIKEIKNAMNSVRDMVETLGNHLSIIQTRMDFTDAMTDILQTGADDLVLADMNEESANYLALQTRNSLAVNALALAAQSNNSVLKLF